MTERKDSCARGEHRWDIGPGGMHLECFDCGMDYDYFHKEILHGPEAAIASKFSMEAVNKINDQIVANTKPGPRGCLFHNDMEVGRREGCQSCAAFLSALEETKE